MNKSFKNFLRKILVCSAALTLIAVVVTDRDVAYALGEFNLRSHIITYPINERTVNIAPGVVEKHYSFEDSGGKRTEAFVVYVDIEDPQVSIEAGTPYDKDDFGMQTVSRQAQEVSERGHRVVAAVNGDYYNMATGEPLGIVYKDGRLIRNAIEQDWRFFAVTTDGKAVIGDEDLYEEIKNEIKEALGGHAILVKDRQPYEPPKFNGGRNPRTGVGIKADGSVFFVTVDGRQEPYSGGITAEDFASLMIDLGAETALDLDGGGSTTYVSRNPGDEDVSIINKPSGGERKVANSWLVVSTARSNNIFRSAFIEPYDKSFTPGSVVQFSAKGMDKSISPAPMPKTRLEWKLSSNKLGDIDADGKFISNGRAGQVQVLLDRYNRTRGTSWIEIQDPDEMYFIPPQITVRGDSQKSLNLTLRFQKRVLNWNSKDIDWEVPKGLGMVDEKGILHAVKNAKPGKIIARYKNSNLTAEVDVAIAPSPKIMFDFEGILKSWKSSVVGRGERASTDLSVLPEKKQSLGKKALKINYNFTKGQKQSTLGVYAGPGDKIKMPGNPSSVGMWIYATSKEKNYWLRMAIIDDAGNLHNINITPSTGVNWTGWKYIEAQIPDNLKGPFFIHPSQAIRIMSTSSGITGPMTKGSIYVDNISAVY